MDHEIGKEHQRFIDIHDLIEAMKFTNCFEVIVQRIPVIVKGSKGIRVFHNGYRLSIERTAILFEAMINLLSNQNEMIEQALVCFSQLSLEKESKLIFKRFISIHMNKWNSNQIVLVINCLLQLIDSKMDINLISILFSLFPKMQPQSYYSYLDEWKGLFDRKKCIF